MKYIELKNGKKWNLNEAYNGDCLEFMSELPDKCIDLVLTDPPYGIGVNMNAGKRKNEVKKYKDKNWDSKIPDRIIFDEIFRISKHQIIWGGDYFNLDMKYIIWNKMISGDVGFSKYEYASNSFDSEYEIKIRAQNTEPFTRIHPTQKPLKLFKWCLEKYAPENAIVFDPFLGSFTTAVACHSHGLNWIGCEKDEDYFKSGMDRYETECLQGLLGF